MNQKNIILRGISRNPSDRSNPDGGCSESLNVELKDGEIACALKPQTIVSLPWEILYIHKTPNFKTYIVLNARKLTAVFDTSSSMGRQELTELASNEVVNSISSIGNTLIVATSITLYYFVYLKGEYESARGQILDGPKISFIADRVATKTVTLLTSGPHEGHQINPSNSYTIPNPSVVTSQRNSYRASKQFASPVFMVAAYRLANGDYVWGVPQLVSFKSLSENFLRLTANEYTKREYDPETGTEVDVDYTDFILKTDVLGYKIKAQLFQKEEIKQLGSLVQSIDFLMSDDIFCWSADSKNIKVELMPGSFIGQDYVCYLEGDSVESSITNASIFHLVKSIDISHESELQKLSEGMILDLDDYVDPDLRSALPYVESDINSHHKSIIDSMMTYNNRLLAAEAEREFSSGTPFLPTTMQTTVNTSATYTYEYHLKTASGADKVVKCRSANGNIGFSKGTLDNYGFLLYPDSRCEKVRIYSSESSKLGKMLEIEMKQHPTLPMYSYAFIRKEDRCKPISAVTWKDGSPTAEDKTEKITNRIYISETDNPFSFSAKGVQDFSDAVIGFSLITTPLSQGQFGQFSVYVFTEGGIWALGIASDGSLSSAKPVSQDVAIKGTISQLDQAIAFTTERGVMLLSGQSIDCISENMNGSPDIMNDDAVKTLLTEYGAEDLLGVISDNTSFMEFMRSARCAYDYTGKRLLFFNKNETYQYVFSIANSSWHKLQAIDFQFTRVLNAYPSAWVTGLYRSSHYIFDFSTKLGTATDNSSLKGIIITRPLKLDSVDAYKSIARLFPRGDYQKGNVKYIILGSRDNVNYTILHSFRGPSFKYFKIVILSNLLPDERLAYLELWYENKFLNKPR